MELRPNKDNFDISYFSSSKRAVQQDHNIILCSHSNTDHPEDSPRSPPHPWSHLCLLPVQDSYHDDAQHVADQDLSQISFHYQV